jgi:hypothetical protein
MNPEPLHTEMHRGSGCGCTPDNWCGDVLELVDDCDRNFGVCHACLVHTPHEHAA